MYLAEVGSYIPETRVAIGDLQNYLGLSRPQKEIFSRFHNIQRVPVGAEKIAKHLLRPALTDLFQRTALAASDVESLIYCHTIQQVAPFPTNPLSELQKEFGMEKAEAFSLTMQNCASSITAMDVLKTRFAVADAAEMKAVVLTGEKAFTPSVQLIPHTTIMGEASAAVLFSKTGDRNEVLSVKQKTLGKFCSGVGLDAATLKEFDEAYVPTLAEVMHAALAEAGVELNQVRWILAHNINLSSWRRVAKALDFPLNKVFLKGLPDQGHCFCSDVFLNYRAAFDEGLIAKGDYLVMASVGLGATFAAAVLRH